VGETDPVSQQNLLLAAKRLGLKAKVTSSSVDRLTAAPLPALAVMNDGRIVVLAQCDGQRVLFMDPSVSTAEGAQAARPTIEPLEVFAGQWSGELILVTSRASLAGSLAKFDFSWFIPSIVRHRKLLGEVLLVSHSSRPCSSRW
jgi:subfamily B ATP-binding cassette protein HlyB/CyaB